MDLSRTDHAADRSIDFVLCDNFTPDMLKEVMPLCACQNVYDMLYVQAVKLRDESGKNILLEASGGVNINCHGCVAERRQVNMETIGEIAKSGVDRISVSEQDEIMPLIRLFSMVIRWEASHIKLFPSTWV